MKVLVTIQETKVIERTYEVNGVNSLEMAAKCADRCAKNLFQPNAYMRREVPLKPTYRLDRYEVIEP